MRKFTEFCLIFRKNRVVSAIILTATLSGLTGCVLEESGITQISWYEAALAALLIILTVVAVFLARSRSEGKRLEREVRKRTKEVVQQTAILTALFDAIPDLIYAKDCHLRYTHRNKAFSTYHDVLEITSDNHDESTEDSYAQAHAKLVEYSNVHDDINSRVIRENRTISEVEAVTRGDGTTAYYETTRVPLANENGAVVGVLGISRDITKFKEVEQMLSRESQSKSSFLANMSHEIRTPLNTIVGVTNILLMDEAADPKVADGLGKIYTACNLLLGIINDILDLSKIEVGKLDITLEEYDVARLINDSVQMNTLMTIPKPIEFELKVDPEVPARLIGDGLRIKQVLNNLLSNAFKYTDSGKVTLSAYVEHHQPESEHEATGGKYTTLVFGVRDTGHGMTKSQLGKIFDEYSRFNRGTRGTIEGTGLGLAVVQRLIGLMGGKVTVESEPDQGTLFTVHLRQAKVDDEVLGKETAENLMQLKLNEQKKIGEKAPAPLSHGKVLVVDDVESNLHVAMGLLNLYSLKIETATSGREAIDKVRTVMDATTPAKSELYDIIFMDHMMPKMDGIEAVKLIRDMGYTSPIVALTANATAGHENMFFRNGFDDFIAKPIDLRLLDMTLNKFIHSLQSGGSGESLQSEVEEVAAVKNTESTEVTARRPRVNPNVSTLPRSLLLECFINDARNSLEMLEGFTESPDFDGFAGEDNSAKGDLRDYITCVHGIKSALYNIGETDLSELAYDLESSGRKGDSATIVATTPTLIWELKAVVLKAEAELKSGDSRKSKGTLGDEDFRERLAQVKQACDNYSRKLALNLIAEIEAYTLDSPASEVLEKIKNYVLNTDFEEAATEIQKYMGEES